jgi:histidine decarboxylase
MRRLPYEKKYCYGYGFEPASSPKYNFYTAAATAKKALIKKKLSHLVSSKLDYINAFDIAETQGAYLGQINLIVVSSFIGPNGYLFGYEVAKHPNLYQKKLDINIPIDVYSAVPLFESTKKLFGTLDSKHFPMIPGGHTPAASKSIEKSGPCYIYGGIGVGIVRDRNKDAIILMEDIGWANNINEETAKFENRKMKENIAKSVLEISKNQHTELKEIFIHTDYLHIHEDEVGCILTAVPYMTLPKVALLDGIDTLERIDLVEWEERTNQNFICNTTS